MKQIFLLFLSVFSIFGQTGYQPDALMLRFPDVSENKIVFVYEQDLWLVDKKGGTAVRLTSAEGSEIYPKFSPDGTKIAFSGAFDGATNVYVINTLGGMPIQLTYHPYSETVLEWYPDNKNILYKSSKESPRDRFNQFYKVSELGGISEKLPLFYGELASFNSVGDKIVFQTISRELRTWKRYRGGMASDLWLYDLNKNHSEKITDFEGTDALPMWHKNKLYFLSDRDENKKLNIWEYDFDQKSFKQITFFDEYDVKWPSLGPNDIVFENGGKLYLLDLDTKKYSNVIITIASDLPDLRESKKNAADLIEYYDLSHDGKRAVFNARGELFSVPAEHGNVRNITNTSGIAERYPVYSPNGKYIAYISDKTGEYEIYLRETGLNKSEKQITKGGKVYIYYPLWSPDSKKLAYRDKAGNLFYLDIESGIPIKIDKNDFYEFIEYSFSPDSRFIAYSKNENYRIKSIYFYELETKKINKISTGFYSDSNPVFDPEGKYLYFYSEREFNPIYSDFQHTWVYNNSSNLYAAVLQKDGKSPIAPISDEVEVKTENENKDSDNEKKDEKINDLKTVIDFDGIETRIYELEEVGNSGGLFATKGKVVFEAMPRTGEKNGKRSVKYFDLKEQKVETIITGISDFSVNASGEKIIYRAEQTYGIIDIEKGKNVGDGKIDVSNLPAKINLREEWEQMFNEAWRVQRDYFYDPDMHEVDWEKMRKRYSKLLPYCSYRGDLNYIIGEMIAELNVSHAYVYGGDMQKVKNPEIGLLGCDFQGGEKYFKFSKIYEGAKWDFTDERSPLSNPSSKVEEGEYLIAINGITPDISKDVYASFEGLAGKITTLTVNSVPSIEGARDVVVKTMKDERRLRYLDWINTNRIKVENATNGECGYIYVPNTGVDGQTELLRQFIPQHNKKALIIDERFNSGGQIPDRFVELLNRPIYNYWARRDFEDYVSPWVNNPGAKVMLMNGWSGSGGDAFPYYFRAANLGKLVGKRTWGGLVGISGNPGLIDGGYVTAPTFGFWNTKGEWDVENYGVDPDYDIENYPHNLSNGIDEQLNKAIEVIKEELRNKPYIKPEKPAYPDRSK